MKNLHDISLCVPDFGCTALSILENDGYEAWLVGGFVRDSLLKRPCHDLDIATSATWQEGKRLFEEAGCAVFETGIKHGTITVSVDGGLIEVTTFRSEGAYTDNRHPDSVEFLEHIEDDLARRDFTINALAYHPQRGLRDPYDGLNDLENKIIRAVGEPAVRFSEDALRILRAARFSSQLGFCIEENTASAMEKLCTNLTHIAVERIFPELDCFMRGEYIHDTLMEHMTVIGEVIPEALPMIGLDQKTPYHIYDVLEHTAYCIQNTPATTLLRWSAFFHDIGKPAAFFTDETGRGHFYGHAKISVEIATQVMKRLKFPLALRHQILLLVAYHDDVVQPNPKAVKRMLRKLDEDPQMFRALCLLKKADALAQAPQCHPRVELAHELENILDEVLVSEQAFSLRNLAITGSDILALGVNPGPRVGELLETALDAVIEGDVVNEHAALLSYVEGHLSSENPI